MGARSNETTDSCVFALKNAFASALQVFKKLRRNGKRRGPLSEEEVRLAQSLKKAPTEIELEYRKNRSLQGRRFEEGDLIAKESLFRTLVKLNTGLVDIIASFLTGKRHDAKLDYRSLTSLSELSRAETIDALSQLSYRLSRSNLSLIAPNTSTVSGKKHQKSKSDGYGNTATVRRIQASNASAPQLAVVRPRSKLRTQGSGSSSHRSSHSHKKQGEDFLPPKSPLNKSTPYLPRPTALPTPPPSPPQLLNSPARGELEDWQQRRRRQDKFVPSMYTFASGSTKLGEIPMRKWNMPYDYEEMARKNAEAAINPPVCHGHKRKGGLLRRFRRTEGES